MTDVAMIRQTAQLFMPAPTVLELRVLHAPRQGTVSGYFADPALFTKAADAWSGRAPGVYATLNPCLPDVLARASNRLKPYARSTTTDTEIVHRRWLPLDFDPVRPADISSTEAEHTAAMDRATACTDWLRARGWPAPVAADSGNGGHRLYRIDLPNDDASRDLLKRCLEALALYFSDDAVKLDVGVCNAARIWKVYGTLACKGDDVPARPHRLARLLEVPTPVEVVSLAQLQALAALVPDAPTPPPRAGPHHARPLDLAHWLPEHGLTVVSSGAWEGKGTRWVLNPCPWNSAHTNKSAFVVQFASGALAAGCHHNGCQGETWHTLRDLVEPGWNTTTAARQAQRSTNGQTAPPPPAPADLPPTGPEPRLPYSDYTNALAFVRDHGAILRYCHPWKAWLVWTGTHWERDTSGAVMQLAKQTIKRLARQMEHLDDEAATALMRHIKASLSTAKLKALVENAQNEPGIPVQPQDFDTDVWLLNCTNGTLDLRTGTLRPHRQGDLLTKCLTIPYAPDAPCPTWQAFLWRIMGGSQGQDDPDMRVGELAQRQQADARATTLMQYLQRCAGYTLTGSTKEQCLFLCHGPTKTGKTTYLATLRTMLGPYATQTDMETFMHKDRPEVRNDLADLAGTRMVYAVESQEGKRLAEGLVKQMTGGADHLKARFLFQEYFEFAPQFKAYIGTNHLPVIKDSDDAIWERIRKIPFPVQIPKAERDKDLDVKLAQELPGILAWAVQGCRDWQAKHDLAEPEAVLTATQSYRTEMDSVARFLDECCLTAAPDIAKVKAPALSTAYHGWCKRTGEEPLTNPALIAALEKRGFHRARGTGNQYYWHGVGLVNTDDGRSV